VRSPLRYFGGKHYLASRIVSLLPRHRVYVEPFCGAAWVLFAKRPSPVETINDIDGEVVNFFRVLRDPALFQEFHRVVALTPFSRQEHADARSKLGRGNEVERAVSFFVTARQSFSGRVEAGGWRYSRADPSRGMASAVADYLGAIDGLPQAHARLMRVQIENDDALSVIRRYDTPETLFYCDPPYPATTRRSGGYRHEMAEAEHERLLTALVAVEGKVILSSYPNDLYNSILGGAGWDCTQVQVPCHAAGRTRGTGLLGDGACDLNQRRIEVIWRNPAALEGTAQLTLAAPDRGPDMPRTDRRSESGPDAPGRIGSVGK
jgi:DNA adenine methylase